MSIENRFYNILKAIEGQLSSLTKIKTNIGKFSGIESIALVPSLQELLAESHNTVNYRYIIAILYKNSKDLDTRELTQKSSIIIDALNKTRTDVSSTIFYDPRVENIDFQPEIVEGEEEGIEAGEQLDLLINFGVSTQELIT